MNFYSSVGNSFGPFIDGRNVQVGIVARSGRFYDVPSIHGGVTSRFCGEWAYATQTVYSDGRVTTLVNERWEVTKNPTAEEIAESHRRESDIRSSRVGWPNPDC